MSALFRLLACSFLLAVSSALPNVPSSILSREASLSESLMPIPPSQDPFYVPPASFISAAPGTVLRVRRAPGNLTSIFNASSSAYNILYRTTNSRYQPSWAVTTLFAPLSSSLNSTSSVLLSYQIPYNTADVDHSPSYAFYSELSVGLILMDINAALGYGWYVNVPDFEGPSASFGSGVQEGHATLDSIRAVLSSSLGLTSDARYAMWGYSGGSIASEWAAELQAQYAPELSFSGMALGGIVPNLTSVLHSIDATPAAGLIPSALIGITNQYPAAYEYLVSKLKISGLHNATGFLAVKSMSYFQAAVTFANQNILDEYFDKGASTLNQPIIQKIFNTDGLMGYHGVPQMPAFLYKAVHDEYSPVEDADTLVARYCAAGANILYQRNTIGNHVDEETNGDARALNWLRTMLNGPFNPENPQQGCTVQNVAVNLTSHGPFAPPS